MMADVFCVIGAEILARKAGGCIVRTSAAALWLPYSSGSGGLSGESRGEAHGLLVPPYYPVCWLVFLCIRHYIRDSKVSFPLNCKLQVKIHYYLLLPIITYFFSEMLHMD